MSNVILNTNNSASTNSGPGAQPIRFVARTDARPAPGRQRLRRVLQMAFFALFVLAPPLDIFRLDLTLGHFILFGQDWTLGLDGFQRGEIGSGEALFNLITRGFLPIALVVGLGVWVSWKYGRLYCGWLCPHFSVVEMINGLMRRASGKPSLWDRHALPERLPDGRRIVPRTIYWLWTGIAVIGFALLWAVALLTYLLPPAEVYPQLLSASLTPQRVIFLGVATAAFAIEFTLARHLFCRFGCGVGLVQSLAWMGNRRALVVGFDRARVKDCTRCDQACDHACPMRLKPRASKRHIFTCTQCTQCMDACSQVSTHKGSLLHWVQGREALDKSTHVFGHRED